VPNDRLHRWRARLRTLGTVEDRAPGGVALHALRRAEVDAIFAVTEQWGEVDRSHRKLAHRGAPPCVRWRLGLLVSNPGGVGL
jgi:hypothetical protein